MTSDGDSPPPLVGVIGAGAMGCQFVSAFATRFPTLVYDLDPRRAHQAAETAQAQGSEVSCEAIPEVMVLAQADVIVTMLTDSNAVDAALWQSGLGQALRRNSLVIDMGSSEPERTRENAARLAELGVAMLDAPVSGGVARARSRTLTVIVGGSAEILDRARPLLNTVAESIFHVGGIGTGHAAKALNNLSSACGLLISIEAVETGRRFGIDPQLLVDLLNHATGRNNATETKLGQYVLSGSYDSGFLAQLMAKDLRIAKSLFADTGAESALTDAVVSTWIEMTNRLAPDADQTEIAELIMRR
jgi:3-hydroxyisobutyrate dehydrogenase